MRHHVGWARLVIPLVLVSSFATVVSAPRAEAVVGAYVEIHKAACPPGYDPFNLFEECHDNRLPGVEFIAEGPGDVRYEDRTDAQGRVVFGDFLQAGTITIAEARPSGEFADYVVYCSLVDTLEPIDVEKRGNGRAAVVFELPQEVVDAGTGIVCDWYNLPPAAPPLPTGSIEIHTSACPAGVRENLFEQCHAHGLAGVQFLVQGPQTARGTTAGPIGAVRFTGLPAGAYTIAEVVPAGDFAEYVVYCSDATRTEVPFEYRGNGRAAIQLNLVAGQQIICDWYNIPAAHALPTPVPPPAFESGGIGLTRTEWRSLHGSGTRVGPVVIYEDGKYAVAYTSGLVTFIETDWENEGGIDAADAADVVRALLPADARLVQRYYLPPTPGGPVGLAIERYESASLAIRLSAAPLDWDGSIVVVYQHQQPEVTGEPTPMAEEPKIMRVSIAAGTRV